MLFPNHFFPRLRVNGFNGSTSVEVSPGSQDRSHQDEDSRASWAGRVAEVGEAGTAYPLYAAADIAGKTGVNFAIWGWLTSSLE